MPGYGVLTETTLNLSYAGGFNVAVGGCADGYTGSGPQAQACTTSGAYTLSGCAATACATYNVPNSDKAAETGNNVAGSTTDTVIVTCNPGYTFANSSNGIVQCQPDGSSAVIWNPAYVLQCNGNGGWGTTL